MFNYFILCIPFFSYFGFLPRRFTDYFNYLRTTLSNVSYSFIVITFSVLISSVFIIFVLLFVEMCLLKISKLFYFKIFNFWLKMVLTYFFFFLLDYKVSIILFSSGLNFRTFVLWGSGSTKVTMWGGSPISSL